MKRQTAAKKKERPKSAKRRPGEPSGTISRLERLKKAPFESDLSRDLVEQRVRKDFQTIFEACVQTPNLDFEATLRGILRFFKNQDDRFRGAFQVPLSSKNL